MTDELKRLINDGWNVAPPMRQGVGSGAFFTSSSSCFTCGRNCRIGTWDICASCDKHYEKCDCQPTAWAARSLADAALSDWDETPMREKGADWWVDDDDD